MSNRPSICWKCIHREDCKMFEKNPDASVTECGRFIVSIFTVMKDADKAIMPAIYEHFMAESEEE